MAPSAVQAAAARDAVVLPCTWAAYPACARYAGWWICARVDPRRFVVSFAQVREIAAIKLPDLNCTDLDAACNTVMGTARNMGITVEA